MPDRLEDGLGIELFVRKGKRLLGLTPPGEELVVMVERMLLDAASIKRLADQYRGRDLGLRKLDSEHLFAENVTRIAVRRGHYLRGFAYRFIALCAPELTEAAVTDAVGGTAS